MAHVPQHERDGAHAGAADADDVDAPGRREVEARRRQRAWASTSSATRAAASGWPFSRAASRMARRRLGIGQERIELEGQPTPVALVIGDGHRRAHADQRLGVARSGGRAGRRAAGPGWPGLPRPAARPPSWRRPGRRRRRPRCRSRACCPRTAPPGSRGRGSSPLPSSTRRGGRERLVVTSAGHVVERAVAVGGPGRGQVGHGAVDPAGAERAAGAGHGLAVRRQAQRHPAGRPTLRRRSRVASSGQTGVPVTWARGRSVPAKATALAAAKRPSRPLTAPGTESVVMQTSGTRVQHRGQPGREAGVPADDDHHPRAAGGGTSRGRAGRPRPGRRPLRRWPTRRTDAGCGAPRGRGAGCRGTRASATSWPPAPGGSRRARSTPPRGRGQPARARSAARGRCDRPSRRPRSPCRAVRSPTSGRAGGPAARPGEPQRSSRASPCRATLIRMPAAAMVITSDEPPKEMNGSGMPVTGSTPTTAPTLMRVSAPTQATSPRETQRAEAVGRLHRGPDARAT